MSEAPLRNCPSCGKPKLKRLISAPVFRLKGRGWYETDFKSDQEKKRNLHGDEAKTDKAAATDTKAAEAPAKAETKAEPKAEPKAEATPTAASKSAAKPPSRAKRPATKPARRR
jgi:predicted nucleic acid-binding Zn ribbon protein